MRRTSILLFLVSTCFATLLFANDKDNYFKDNQICHAIAHVSSDDTTASSIAYRKGNTNYDLNQVNHIAFHTPIFELPCPKSGYRQSIILDVQRQFYEYLYTNHKKSLDKVVGMTDDSTNKPIVNANKKRASDHIKWLNNRTSNNRKHKYKIIVIDDFVYEKAKYLSYATMPKYLINFSKYLEGTP